MKQPAKDRTDPKTSVTMCDWCALRPATTTAMMPVQGKPLRLNVCPSCKGAHK